MPLSKFFDFIKLALPEDVQPRELEQCVPQEMWTQNPYEAALLALRECPRLNWNAYLERNPDVKQSGVEPHLHYARHGLYEGRKLVSWHGLKEPEKPGAPLVSIVLINYNNAHLLYKCLDSVTTQTLQDIEIIVVDDCSTDESLAIIQDYAARDKRIKTLVNEQNSATLITRKRGVMAATGRYLMFLDSDDYMAPNACETAAREISKGYDMVKFGTNVFSTMNTPRQILSRTFAECNKGENREYYSREILSSMFIQRNVNWLVWTFVYLREMVVAAFNELPDERLTGADDVLAVLSISRRARNMLKIPDLLYFYNYGPGVSLTGDKTKIFRYLPALCGSVKHIRQYAEKYSLNIGIESLYEELCDHQIHRIMQLASEKGAAKQFAALTDILGFEYVFKILIERHGGQDIQIASIIRPLPEERRHIQHIGIYYPSLGPGGVEVVIQALCRQFENSGYSLTIFTEEKSEKQLEFPTYVHIVYITPRLADGNTVERMLSFERAVTSAGIDVMLHAGTWRTHILWDLLLLHQHAIPVIFLYHFNFAISLIGNNGHELHFQDLVFKNAEAVTCLSTMEEMYLRSRGVNAVYVPNPIKQFTYIVRSTIPAKIAVVGRFGSWIKQVGQSLKVLREIVNDAPWVSMCLVGDFYDNKQREEYRKKVKEYGLEKNVELTGWVKDTNSFLKQCGVLLSTSYFDTFPLNIAEAQALGLPCVIYDIVIEQARDNPSIIKVPQGNYRAAAAEIISLLKDHARWSKLSRIAVENSKKYAPEKFMKNMRELLENFQSQMPLRQYAYRDYADLTKNMSFYSKYKEQSLWK